jgi:hypothetical protein
MQGSKDVRRKTYISSINEIVPPSQFDYSALSELFSGMRPTEVNAPSACGQKSCGDVACHDRRKV